MRQPPPASNQVPPAIKTPATIPGATSKAAAYPASGSPHALQASTDTPQQGPPPVQHDPAQQVTSHGPQQHLQPLTAVRAPCGQRLQHAPAAAATQRLLALHRAGDGQRHWRQRDLHLRGSTGVAVGGGGVGGREGGAAYLAQIRHLALACSHIRYAARPLLLSLHRTIHTTLHYIMSHRI